MQSAESLRDADMKQIEKTAGAKAARPQTFVILPDWVAWTFYWLFLLAIVGMIGTSLTWIAHGLPLHGILLLAAYGFMGYRMSTFFYSLPMRLAVRKQILSADYFSMEAEHRRAITIVNKLHMPHDDNYAGLWFNLGLAQMQQGKYKEAEETYEQAIGAMDKMRLQNKWLPILLRLNLATVLVRSERLNEALEIYDQCEARMP
jgi:tetratricopeptide (TPR) repeat protein